MKSIERKRRSLLIWSIIASVCLPLGIAGTVVGATKGIGVLLGFGIAAIVFGFYGSPVLWIQFGQSGIMRRLVVAVETDNLYTLKEISSAINMNEKETEERIKTAITKRYLVGYLYENGELRVNSNVKKFAEKRTVVCTACGAKFVADAHSPISVCPYCGTEYGREKR